MADRFELVALGLPPDCAPESLPACIAEFIAACWNGMSRAHLLDRARRLALRASLRALKEQASPTGRRVPLRGITAAGQGCTAGGLF